VRLAPAHGARRLAFAAATGRRRSLRALGAALASALLLGACGGLKAPDLFLVERTGPTAGAQLTLLVNEEGGVRCNGGPTRKLQDAQLIEARTIQEDMRGPASKHIALAPGGKPVFSYRLREESGSVSFADDSSGQPSVFHKLALFVLQTAQRVCHLPI
jgi:hypothetical protein